MGILGAIRRLGRGQFVMIPAELNPRAQTASNRTSLDRYPELFKAAASALPAARRVLSYGCSTGEECATLSNYFPHAEIVGADINRVNLAIAHRRFDWPQIQFVHPDDRRLTQLAPFDAIFCMSVLRTPYRRRHKSRAIAAYPFARFEEQVAFLDGELPFAVLAQVAMLGCGADGTGVFAHFYFDEVLEFALSLVQRRLAGPVDGFVKPGHDFGLH